MKRWGCIGELSTIIAILPPPATICCLYRIPNDNILSQIKFREVRYGLTAMLLNYLAPHSASSHLDVMHDNELIKSDFSVSETSCTLPFSTADDHR